MSNKTLSMSDTLFAYLREHLSPQKTPRYWFEVEAYPLTRCDSGLPR